ncbi:PhnD/SsuA/transferrin family substrate-binding protein [Brasilonema sp. UFV-L1]|uniref:phosphate/phosphite/phosphonate ABC transporter substrate-binding protein n=1 Tax=Brasilonema sp. UFV-L1 TaxID=2234130 RepID=UPI00145F0526|nr:PhnD/SsuA/transferrin family substrate-binding protein [Brasilonema sp. UFV-L1]NMG09619.1 phosphonate ABC transporter substrate-binding protein [Brasilonema sp. UFV-L1]
MPLRLSRKLFILVLLFVTNGGCKPAPANLNGQLVIGVVSYTEGQQILERYTEFNRYLAKTTGTRVELEPAYNENKALERIHSQAWSLVFASPGVAASAIADHQYRPLFLVQGFNHSRSILVVRNDSQIRELKQLEGKTVALGQQGSAAGYYFPVYNLYGLTLAEVLFAPTPKIVLELVAQGKAAAGALSLAEYNLYSPSLSNTQFRVLYIDPHNVPADVVLIAPNIEPNRQEEIRKIMSAAPLSVVREIGYVPNVPVPDYDYMISVVRRVKSIDSNVRQKPARLF